MSTSPEPIRKRPVAVCKAKNHDGGLLILQDDRGRRWWFCSLCQHRRDVKAGEMAGYRGPIVNAAAATITVGTPTPHRYVAAPPPIVLEPVPTPIPAIGVSNLCAHGLHGIANLIACRTNGGGFYWRCQRCGSDLLMGPGEAKAHKLAAYGGAK